jgi:hypothetical protein
VNRKHLLWYVFQYMESQKMELDDMIEILEQKGIMFSDNPEPGEWSVARALSHAVYDYETAKEKMNG